MLTLTLALVALVQDPNCVGTFHSVDLAVPAPQTFRPTYVQVDGDDAVAYGDLIPAQVYPYMGLCMLRRDPVSLEFAVELVRPYSGAPGDPHHVGLRGGTLAYSQRVANGSDIVVLRRDPIMGAWTVFDVIHAPLLNFGSPPTISVSESLVAFHTTVNIEVWRRGPTRMELAVAFSSLYTYLDGVSGDRVVLERQPALELHRCPPGGGSFLEAFVMPPTGYAFMGTNLEDDLLITLLRELNTSTNGPHAIATWRILADPSGTTMHLESLRPYVANPEIFLPLAPSKLRGDSLVYAALGDACGNGALERHVRVEDISPAGILTPRSNVCSFAGAPNRDLLSAGFDGRTLAVLFDGNPGRLLFAALPSLALDRDHDCVDDATQIRVDPSLDRNQNGRLDTSERVGEAFCAQLAPNSTGAFSGLALVGTPSASSQDLAAVATGLPPSVVGVTLVAFAPTPLPAQATTPFGLCQGGGNFGRHGAVVSDATGVAVTPIRPAALPSVHGSASALTGQSWAWQHVHRDGPVAAATPAVAVQIW